MKGVFTAVKNVDGAVKEEEEPEDVCTEVHEYIQ